MTKTRLFHSESPGITIDIVAFIDGATGDLVIEGYDIGPRVEELWGDSDYEYWLRVAEADRSALLKSLSPGRKDCLDSSFDDSRLLDLIAATFNTDKAVSMLEEHCGKHRVPASFSSCI